MLRRLYIFIWQNWRQRKGKAEHWQVSAFSLAWLSFFLLIRLINRRNGTVQVCGQAGVDSLAKPGTIWYIGDIKKNPPTGSTWMSKLISHHQTEGYLTSGTDEWNDKQGENKEKKSKWLCNNLGSEQREVPGLTYSDKEFQDFDTKNPLKFNKNERK